VSPASLTRCVPLCLFYNAGAPAAAQRLADVIGTILHFSASERSQVLARAKAHKGWLAW